MSKISIRFLIAVFIAALGVVVVFSVVAARPDLEPIEQLGKLIFFDTNLSVNSNQSCATCHGPNVGWTGPNEMINEHGTVYMGSISGAFGNRKPPSSGYATQSPILHMTKKGEFVGGSFWDGRATGEKLGNPAADQAQGPFLNPKEMALPSPAAVVTLVCEAAYADLFMQVWGDDICDPANVNMAYDDIALSIAVYEASPEVNAFTSKYDYAQMNQATLTKEERKGFALFQQKGNCKSCHASNGQHALFTDFTYINAGFPKNPENPVYTYDPGYIDLGLGAFLATRSDYAAYADMNMGRHKIPTLRNVDLRPTPYFTKAYGHNGYFKSLWSIVHFYNTRDVLARCSGDYTEAQALAANCWPAPEVTENMDNTIGDLGLTYAEEQAIVAFLKTLSDGYIP